MSIRILQEACLGCGRCVEACPGNLIRSGPDGTAVLRQPENCWGCTACLKECTAGAIRYFLGADIGGRGSTLHVRREGPLFHWILESPGREPVVLTVDARQSNAY